MLVPDARARLARIDRSRPPLHNRRDRHSHGVVTMKLAFVPLGKLSVSKTNMRFARKRPDVADILPSVRTAPRVVPVRRSRHRRRVLHRMRGARLRRRTTAARRHVAALSPYMVRGWARCARSLVRRARAVHALPFLRGWRGCPVRFGPAILVFTGTGEARSSAADHDEAPVIRRMTAGRLGSDATILAYFAGADVVVSCPVVSR